MAFKSRGLAFRKTKVLLSEKPGLPTFNQSRRHYDATCTLSLPFQPRDRLIHVRHYLGDSKKSRVPPYLYTQKDTRTGNSELSGNASYSYLPILKRARPRRCFSAQQNCNCSAPKHDVLVSPVSFDRTIDLIDILETVLFLHFLLQLAVTF